MKSLSTLIFALLTVGSISALAAVPSPESFQDEVLNLRIQEILLSRKAALQACSTRSALGTLSRIDNEPAASDSRAKSLQLLELYRQTESLKADCGPEIAQADQTLEAQERRNFSGLEKALETSCDLLGPTPPGKTCLAHATQLVQDLDPNCMSAVEKDKSGMFEHNACLAGDHLDISIVESGETEPQFPLPSRFLNALGRAIKKTPNGGSLDLWQIYRESEPSAHDSDPSARLKFLAVMVYFEASNTSFAGWTDEWADNIWRKAIAAGRSPVEALSDFNQYKFERDLYLYDQTAISKKDLKITVESTIVTQANHHEYMSAFLSCYYETKGDAFDARLLPNALGLAYLSKDIVSHSEIGVPIQQSLSWFSTDIGEYSDGVKLALPFCKQ